MKGAFSPIPSPRDGLNNGEASHFVQFYSRISELEKDRERFELPIFADSILVHSR